jgi:hypothetical protein
LFDRLDLPDAFSFARTPRSKRYEPVVEESFDCTIDTTDVDPESVAHPCPAEVGRTSAIGRKRHQEEDRGCVRLESGKPVIMK